jgi:hypothetical protein
MFQLNPNNSEITPFSVITYDWLNALQDEVCTPIEKTVGLSKRTTDMLRSIKEIFEWNAVSLGEITNYSGLPQSLRLKCKKDELSSVFLHLDLNLKRSNDPQLTLLPEASFKQITELVQKTSDLFFDVSSSNFKNLSEFYSSPILLDASRLSRADNKDYTPVELPQIPGISEEDLTRIIRRLNAQSFLEKNPMTIQQQFSFSQSGFERSFLIPPFTCYPDLKELTDSLSASLRETEPSDYQESLMRSLLFRLYFQTLPANLPIILCPDESGQLHYFYNRMMYGDELTVKASLFNLNMA